MEGFDVGFAAWSVCVCLAQVWGVCSDPGFIVFGYMRDKRPGDFDQVESFVNCGTKMCYALDQW